MTIKESTHKIFIWEKMMEHYGKSIVGDVLDLTGAYMHIKVHIPYLHKVYPELRQELDRSINFYRKATHLFCLHGSLDQLGLTNGDSIKINKTNQTITFTETYRERNTGVVRQDTYTVPFKHIAEIKIISYYW